LTGIVEIRGFVEEDELDALLDRAHLALNLRYPTVGEASGSQLRLWSRGLPSVVTRTGWYAELPPETTFFVDPEHEVDDLHRHFRAALENPRMLLEMGQAGRRQLERQHHPDLYARELVDGMRPMIEAPVSVMAPTLMPVTDLIKGGRLGDFAKWALANRTAEEFRRWLTVTRVESHIPNSKSQ
jgi:hypothetical protein